MKIQFTREFIIKDLNEKFKWDSSRMAYKRNAFFIEKYKINDPKYVCYNYPTEINYVINNSYSDTIVIIDDSKNQFELEFFGWNYYRDIFNNVPTYAGVYNNVFYKNIFNIDEDRNFKTMDPAGIRYLIETNYIFIESIRGKYHQELILNTNKNGEIIFPEFDDIVVDIEPELLRDSEITRKIRLQSMIGEDIIL